MKVLVVSNDAGGAEIVSSWVRQNSGNDYHYLLSGPAEKIFQNKFDGIINNHKNSLRLLIQNADFVLTGTSHPSEHEKKAILLAKIHSIKSATFLDYWSGFRKRFKLNGDLVLPDEIWVGDLYAQEIAKRDLPEANIILKENPYIEELLSEKVKLEKINKQKKGTAHFLYLCQPYVQNISNEHEKKVIITDILALEYFFEQLSISTTRKVKIRLRLHPLETPGKYQKTISKFSNHFKICESKGNSLAEDLVWADIAVGMHAQALAVAVLFCRKVYCCIPKGSTPCVLPHLEIGDFKDFKYGNSFDF